VPSVKTLSSIPFGYMLFTVPSGNLLKNVRNEVKYLRNSFLSVGVVLFNLLICKFENLKAIRKCSLSCLGLAEVIDDSLIGVGLLDVTVVKVDNSIAVCEGFTTHFVTEDDFFLSIHIHSLNFSVVTINFIFDRVVFVAFAVVFIWEL